MEKASQDSINTSTKDKIDLITVDRTSAKNRYMKASRNIASGTLIYKVDPLCTATFTHNRHQYCNFCLKQKASLLKCGKCNQVYYCGAECQRQDWALHKKECSIFQSIGPKTNKITNQFILALRCYLKYKEKQEDFSKSIDDLISNLNEFSESKSSFFEEMAVVLMKYMKADPFSEPEGFIPFMKNFIAKLMVNSFTIYNNDNDTIASAIYMPSNFINHSCDPNAIVIYKGRKQFLYALKEIKEGEEINVSYCDYIKPFYDRHRFLLENYFFNCGCKKCTQDKIECSTTLWCQECKKGEILQQGPDKFFCEKCKKDFTWKQVDELDKQLIQCKTALGTQSLAERMKTWDKIKTLVSENSGQNNEVLEAISRMYIVDEKYDEAYQNDRILLKKMKKWCIPKDPMIGWKYLELAKLASPLSKYNKAKEYVSKGLEILDKYFLLDEMPDFKELILDIQNNFQFSLNYEMVPALNDNRLTS